MATISFEIIHSVSFIHSDCFIQNNSIHFIHSQQLLHFLFHSTTATVSFFVLLLEVGKWLCNQGKILKCLIWQQYACLVMYLSLKCKSTPILPPKQMQ